ncbi:MAG: hypothetical protein RSE46_04990 [Janthinobacterium sp.]
MTTTATAKELVLKASELTPTELNIPARLVIATRESRLAKGITIIATPGAISIQIGITSGEMATKNDNDSERTLF